jgi:release factor glutamine methyltransferase
MNEIYSPEDDSFFFAEFFNDYLLRNSDKNIKYLDMGTGSGILSEVALKYLNKKNILAVDLNNDAVKRAIKKGIPAIKSDLFENVESKFDLITFNAPYLPLDEDEPLDSRLATTGGKRGDELCIKFLEDAKNHLEKNGKIFLLVSSLTPLDRIKKFGGKIVARKKIFFEELIIFSFSF